MCLDCIREDETRAKTNKTSDEKMPEIELLKALIRLSVEDYSTKIPSHETHTQGCGRKKGTGHATQPTCYDKQSAGEFLSSLGFDPDKFVYAYRHRTGIR